MVRARNDRRRDIPPFACGRRLLFVGVYAALTMGLFTDASLSSEPTTTGTGTEQQQARMNALFENVSLTVRNEPRKAVTRLPKPVLKYTNPVNSSQLFASMFLWCEDAIPVAVVCPSFRDSGRIYWEWTSLTPEPLVLIREGKNVWEPRAAGHRSTALADASPPAETPAARLTQMRALARRFSVTEERRGSPQEARLLSQPLYRWEHNSTGVIDAAMFGFTETTDPELLLMLEARRSTDTGERQWFYSVARMTSSPIKVALDDHTIWSADGFWRNPRTPQDPYIEATIGQFDPKTFFASDPSR